MAIRTAVLRLVQVSSSGNIVNKNNSTIASVMKSNTELRVYEFKSGSAPNAAKSGDTTALDIHEYLNLEDGDGYSLLHLDQTFIITSNT